MLLPRTHPWPSALPQRSLVVPVPQAGLGDEGNRAVAGGRGMATDEEDDSKLWMWMWPGSSPTSRLAAREEMGPAFGVGDGPMVNGEAAQFGAEVAGGSSTWMKPSR